MSTNTRTLAMQFIEIDKDFFIYKPFELDLTPYPELKDHSDEKIIGMLKDGTLNQVFASGDPAIAEAVDELGMPEAWYYQIEDNQYDDTLGWAMRENVPEAFMEKYEIGSGRGSDRWL